jgi:hypothetical protein
MQIDNTSTCVYDKHTYDHVIDQHLVDQQIANNQLLRIGIVISHGITQFLPGVCFAVGQDIKHPDSCVA